jgi:TonB family protein
MKRTIVAILALAAPALIAQTATQAQPVSTPVLQTRVVQPAIFASAAAPAADPTKTATTPVRISTGVVAPKLVHSVDISRERATLTKVPGRDSVVVVDLTVDEKGKPTTLKVVKSADPFTDKGVLDAVSQYQFKPGTLDGTTVAVPVTIAYTIK